MRKSAPLLVAALGILLASGPSLAQTAAPNDTLTVAFAAEGTTLDPARYSAGVDQYFISQMFEQLVRFDKDLKPVN